MDEMGNTRVPGSAQGGIEPRGAFSAEAQPLQEAKARVITEQGRHPTLPFTPSKAKSELVPRTHGWELGISGASSWDNPAFR